jgi:hypothetical protein
MGKTWKNTLWKDPGMKVQESNIKGLTSFGKKKWWKGKKEGIEKENNSPWPKSKLGEGITM